jgi:cell division protein FtsW
MARKLKSDPILFVTTLLLVVLSVIMVYSASAVLAEDRFHQSYWFLQKQLVWATIGMAALWVAMNFDYTRLRQPVIIWASLALVGVGLVLVLFGAPVNGAKRWLSIFGLGIQPSELAKLSAIIFIAALLDKRMHRINELGYCLVPVGLVVVALVSLILLEPDFGTSISLLLIASAMVFGAGLRFRYILGLALVGLPALAVLVMGTPYRRRRMLTFLHPYDNPRGDGFQIIQSFIAVGTGGISGRGLMKGVQKLFYLPEPHTDFIYAVISEELGLIGATLVLLCFCVITWRGLRIAMRAPDTFGSLLALGLTMMVAVQAFVNISVVLGLIPTKGIPLPFVSAGGSSLLINLIGMGVLLNVSRHTSTEA